MSQPFDLFWNIVFDLVLMFIFSYLFSYHTDTFDNNLQYNKTDQRLQYIKLYFAVFVGKT